MRNFKKYIHAMTFAAIFAPLTASAELVALWELGDADPGAADSLPIQPTGTDSVGNYDLLRTGAGPTYTSDTPSCTTSQLAVSFPGVGGTAYRSPDMSSEFGSTSWGVEMWVKTNTLTGRHDPFWSGLQHHVIGFYAPGDGTLRAHQFFVGDIGSFNIDVGTWYHIALVHIASTVTTTYYVNGVSQGSSTGTFAERDNFTVGGHTSNSSVPWDGQIDHFRAFDVTGPFDPLTDLNHCVNEVDTDLDGVADDVDQCPATAAGASVDANGCSAAQLDSDGDGVNDDVDLCADTATGDAVDANGCSDADVDGDGDGICDAGAGGAGPSMCTGSDNCPDDANANQANLDGDALGDVCDSDDDGDGTDDGGDNCPVDANMDQLDSDGDGLGDVCDGCPFDADNDIDGDGLCGDIDAGVEFDKAKIYFDQGKIKVDGNLTLPSGYWSDNLDPTGSLTLLVAGINTPPVADQGPVDFEIHGSDNKKWEYKDDHLEFGDIKKLKIDWKGSKFDFHGDEGLKLKTTFIGGTETTFQVEVHDNTGAFTLEVNGTMISYDADRNINANVDYEPYNDDNKKVFFTLPYQLGPDMTIQVTGDVVNHTVAVADHYDEGTVKFKLETRFDPALFPAMGNTTPEDLTVFIALGETVYGFGMINTADWDEIKDDKWKR